jgi:hypothetical protein
MCPARSCNTRRPRYPELGRSCPTKKAVGLLGRRISRVLVEACYYSSKTPRGRESTAQEARIPGWVDAAQNGGKVDSLALMGEMKDGFLTLAVHEVRLPHWERIAASSIGECSPTTSEKFSFEYQIGGSRLFRVLWAPFGQSVLNNYG